MTNAIAVGPLTAADGAMGGASGAGAFGEGLPLIWTRPILLPKTLLVAGFSSFRSSIPPPSYRTPGVPIAFNAASFGIMLNGKILLN